LRRQEKWIQNYGLPLSHLLEERIDLFLRRKRPDFHLQVFMNGLDAAANSGFTLFGIELMIDEHIEALASQHRPE
ncbi:MAG: hypothetical protein ACREP6_04045, partial [Candidatus Binataceae bacterium]